MKSEIDPMVMTVSAGGSVPAGNYTGKFQKAEFLPETEVDPMTGKGGRQFAAIRFSWEITEGDYQCKIVNTETPTADGVKSRRYQVMSWLTGKNPSAGEAVSLANFVGKQYREAENWQWSYDEQKKCYYSWHQMDDGRDVDSRPHQTQSEAEKRCQQEVDWHREWYARYWESQRHRQTIEWERMYSDTGEEPMTDDEFLAKLKSL